MALKKFAALQVIHHSVWLGEARGGPLTCSKQYWQENGANASSKGAHSELDGDGRLETHLDAKP